MKLFTFLILPLALIATAAAANYSFTGATGSVGVPYVGPTNMLVEFDFGTYMPKMSTLTASGLPPGLALHGENQFCYNTTFSNIACQVLITGTPTTAGTYVATIINSGNNNYTGLVTITISSPLVLPATSMPFATTGQAYSKTLTASGGTAPYTWSVASGSLPAGLSLVNGVISGTPATGGTYNFVVQANDSNSQHVQAAYTISVGTPLTIQTATLPDTKQGVTYNQTLTVTGGTAPYTWSLTSGALPPGVCLLAAGGLVGSPTTAGAYNFQLSVVDSTTPTPQGGNRSFTITVNPAFNITNSSLASGAPNVAYSTPLSATNGTAPYTYSVSFGFLPPGLSLSSAGLISGTPTQAGIYNLLLRATDSTSAIVDKQFTLTVTSALRITSSTLPSGSVGQQYAAQMTATNGVLPYAWSLASGSLPPGVTLDSTGLLSGTAATAGIYSFSIKATDSSTPVATDTLSYTVTIANSLLISTPAIPAGILNQAYNSTLTAVGGKSPYLWVLSGGTLPPGLTLNALGILVGTPSSAGLYSFTVTATDSSTPALRYDRVFSLTIGTPLTVTSGTLPDAQQGAQYTQTLTASGVGTTPAWSITAGALPTGITLSPSGTLSGVATVAGSFGFTVSVLDPSTASTASAVIKLIVDPGFAFSTSILPDGNFGVAYSTALATQNGTAPVTYSLAGGTFPTGLTLSAAGTLTGTPTEAGVFPIGISAQDAAGLSALGQFQLRILSGLKVSTSIVPDGTVGAAYLQTLTASSGIQPYTWSLASGTLPPGFTLVPTGDLSGMATVSGSYTFTVEVADSSSPTAATASQTYSITIADQLKVADPTAPGYSTSLGANLPSGEVNVAYTAVLHASGGRAPYGWTLAAGTLPPGLSLSAIGTITGTPTTAGSYPVTLSANDSSSPAASGEHDYTIAINQPLTILTPALPSTVQGDLYQVPMLATGGTSPYIWSISSGSLPPGIELLPDGVMLGTALATGTYSLDITVTDSTPGAALTATLAFSVTASAPLAIGTTAINPVYPNTEFSQQLTASGGDLPYSWSITQGTLPAGLTLASNGTLSGTATTSGAFPILVRLSDAHTPKARTLTLGFAVLVDNPFAAGPASLPVALTGSPYSVQLTTSAGKPPVTYSLTAGILPTGLSLNARTGTLAGTATAAGVSAITITAADSTGQTAQITTMLNVQDPLAIAATVLPAAIQGQSYLYVLPRTNGTPPYTWSLAGTLPNGITLNPAGFISGKLDPSVPAGTTRLVVQVNDASNPFEQAAQAFDFLVTTPLLLVSTNADIPTGTVNHAYSTTFKAQGGLVPYTWSVAGGTLPAGLTLASDGTLCGTPTATGTAKVLISVSDTAGQTASVSVTLVIVDPVTLPADLNLQLGPAQRGVPYSVHLAFTGGTAGAVWAVKSGNLAPGLALARDGTLWGTPTTVGVYPATFQVSSAGLTAQSPGTLTVVDPPPSLQIPLSSVILPVAYKGKSYTTHLTAVNATGSISWTLEGGILPAGLSLATNGTLWGTPSTAGIVAVSVKATDAGSATSATGTYIIQVSDVLGVVTTGLPSGLTGNNYTWQLLAQGGSTPYTWHLISGTLPAGLVLSTSGILSGVPTTAGLSPLTVSISDTSSPVQTATATLLLTVTAGLEITSSALAAGRTGTLYSTELAASGGTGPYTWTAQGTLPDGLTLSSAGVISGTPTKANTTNIVITATDSSTPAISAVKQLSIVINAALAVATTTLPTANAGTAYSAALAATGGTGPYTWTLTQGSLPPGLALSTAGAVSGTPSSTQPATFTVQVTDSTAQTATSALTLSSSTQLKITTSVLPTAGAGLPYTATLAATGGVSPYTWSITQGTLPAGLSFSRAGAFSGSTTSTGVYPLTFEVYDRAGTPQTATATLSLSVASSSSVTVIVAATAEPASQIPIALKIATPPSSPLPCTLTVSFAALAGSTDDGTVEIIQGSAQTRSATCSFPAGTTDAVFPAGAPVLATGTTAGTITLAASTQDGGTGSAQLVMPGRPPEIRSVKIIPQSGGNFTVELLGYSNTREISSAHFQFTYGSTTNPAFDLNVTTLFSAYYGSTESQANGGVFTYSQPFTVTGHTGTLSKVSVALSNSIGTSIPVTITP